MTKKEMKKLGELHAENGLTISPKECQEIDAMIFEYSRLACKHISDHIDRGIARARIYKKMRGAFNSGWNYKYAELTA